MKQVKTISEGVWLKKFQDKSLTATELSRELKL